MQNALDDLWRFTGEMFQSDEVERRLANEGVAVVSDSLFAEWKSTVDDVLDRATLKIPDNQFMMRGGRMGRHTEHLGHMLSEMQIVARSHPGAEW
jgi:ring-1,2-phenylacetyl-CoA epoxidase subunit PaaC